MSEAIPGLTFEPPPARIRPASVVILVRDGGEGREVFWVRRGEKVSFSRGFFAFPGGGVDAADRSLGLPGLAGDEAAHAVCALRELFEETGVMLAKGAAELDPRDRAALRRDLLDGAGFAQILERAGLVLDAGALLPAGRWVTPAFSPVRFDAWFYLAVVPPGTEASIVPGELTEGAWVAPRAALARWEQGTALLHPPNQHALATLAGFPTEAAIPRLRNPPFVDADFVASRIELQRGILMVPLRTPTLPPATHTNCYVAGTGDLALVDPGAPSPSEQERLVALVEELASEGRRPRMVLLTHHHGDHVGGAIAVGRRLGIPVLASAATASRVPGVEGSLEDGTRIVLGGPRPMVLRAMLTEGHARGHLCFVEEASGAILAGDMVANGSTIVVDPPEGDMRVYLESLRRLAALPAGTLYPAHGIAIPDGPAKIAEYIAHRESRLVQLHDALREGPKAIGALVARVYSDTPAIIHPVAERSALASLLLLEARGDVARDGELWRACR